MTAIRENGATSGIGVLATFAYDDLGRRTSLTRSNGNVTSYAYDPVSRLSTMAHDNDASATSHDLTLGFAYNPASQIRENTRSNSSIRSRRATSAGPTAMTGATGSRRREARA